MLGSAGVCRLRAAPKPEDFCRKCSAWGFHQAAPGFWAAFSPQGPVLRDAAWDSQGMVGSASRHCAQSMDCTRLILMSALFKMWFTVILNFFYLVLENKECNYRFLFVFCVAVFFVFCFGFCFFFQLFMVLKVSYFKLREVFHYFTRSQVVAQH